MLHLPVLEMSQLRMNHQIEVQELAEDQKRLMKNLIGTKTREVFYTFVYVCITCLVRCSILSFGQVTRTNGQLVQLVTRMNGTKKRKMRMRTKKSLIA